MASEDVESALTGLFEGLGSSFQKRRDLQDQLNQAISFEKAKRGLSFEPTPVESADIEVKKAQARKDLQDALATEQGSRIDQLLFGGGLSQFSNQEGRNIKGMDNAPVVTGGSRKVGGTTLTFETPRKGEMEAKQEQMKQEVKLSPERKFLQKNLVRLKSLSDSIPKTTPGAKRPFQSMGLKTAGFFQTMPQINIYNRNKKVVLGNVVKTIGGETGSRLSDQDIKRMEEAYPVLPGDTEEETLFAWGNFYQTINDVANVYGAKPIIKPKDLFSKPGEIEKVDAIWKKYTGKSLFENEIGELSDKEQAIVNRLLGQ